MVSPVYCCSTILTTISFVREPLTTLLLNFKSSFCVAVLTSSFSAVSCFNPSCTRSYSCSAASDVSHCSPHLSCKSHSLSCTNSKGQPKASFLQSPWPNTLKVLLYGMHYLPFSPYFCPECPIFVLPVSPDKNSVTSSVV